MTQKVIDISKWQGDVNFTTAKKTGIAGMMLRVAYGTAQDIYYEAYRKACNREGIPFGVYQFATWHYGTTKAQAMAKAKQQAEACISFIKGDGVTGYVALDLELESGYTVKLTKQELSDVANYYMDIIKGAGFSPCLYCSVSWLFDRMVPGGVKYPLWLAYYNDTGSSAFPNNTYGKLMNGIKDRILMWQYSSKGSGKAYGCSSQYIDLNHLYKDFSPKKEAAKVAEKKTKTVEGYGYITTLGAGESITIDGHNVGKVLFLDSKQGEAQSYHVGQGVYPIIKPDVSLVKIPSGWEKKDGGAFTFKNVSGHNIFAYCDGGKITATWEG